MAKKKKEEVSEADKLVLIDNYKGIKIYCNPWFGSFKATVAGEDVCNQDIWKVKEEINEALTVAVDEEAYHKDYCYGLTKCRILRMKSSTGKVLIKERLQTEEVYISSLYVVDKHNEESMDKLGELMSEKNKLDIKIDEIKDQLHAYPEDYFDKLYQKRLREKLQNE